MRAPFSFRPVPILAFAFSFSAFFFAGCASVSVKDMAPGGAADTGRPSRFYVMPFAVDPAGVKENPARKAPGKLGEEAQTLLSGYLVHELSQLGIPAVAAT